LSWIQLWSMGNVGLVTINEFYCFKSKPTQRAMTQRVITILHELAHIGLVIWSQWIGGINSGWMNPLQHLFLIFVDKCEEIKKEYPIFIDNI